MLDNGVMAKCLAYLEIEAISKARLDDKKVDNLEIESISRARLDDKEMDDLEIEAISGAWLDDKEMDQRGDFVNKVINVTRQNNLL